MKKIIIPKPRYFLTSEREVSEAEFIQAERLCGFRPKSGDGVATAGFGGTANNQQIRGRVSYD